MIFLSNINNYLSIFNVLYNKGHKNTVFGSMGGRRKFIKHDSWWTVNITLEREDVQLTIKFSFFLKPGRVKLSTLLII